MLKDHPHHIIAPMLPAGAPLACNNAPLHFLDEFGGATAVIIASIAIHWCSSVPELVVSGCDGQIPTTYSQELVLQFLSCDEHSRCYGLTPMRMPGLMRFECVPHM